MSTNLVSYNNDKRSNYVLIQKITVLLEEIHSFLAEVFIARDSLSPDLYEQYKRELISLTRRVRCCKDQNALNLYQKRLRLLTIKYHSYRHEY